MTIRSANFPDFEQLATLTHEAFKHGPTSNYLCSPSDNCPADHVARRRACISAALQRAAQGLSEVKVISTTTTEECTTKADIVAVAIWDLPAPPPEQLQISRPEYLTYAIQLR